MIRINLLPVREERRKADLRQQAVVLAGSVFGALALVWLVHTYVSSDIGTVQTRITQLQSQLKQFEPQKAELEKFKQKKSEIEKKLETIGRLEQGRSGPVRMMDELATHVPQRVWITGLKTQPGSLEIDGMSLDHELVAALLTKLERSPYFSRVRLDASELKQVGELKLNKFRIRAVTEFVQAKAGAANGTDS